MDEMKDEGREKAPQGDFKTVRLRPVENSRAMRRLVYHPAYLLVITIASIFVSEVLIMLMLPLLPDLTPVQSALADALCLSFLIFPALYFLLLRPVRLLISGQKQLITELRGALSTARTLRGLLPICSRCKKIRDDQGYWKRLEVYIREHSDAEFTHGLCPECGKQLYPDVFKKKD